MEKREHLVVLCDTEEEYAQLFSEYLKKQKGLSWKIHTYTNVPELLQKERSNQIFLLIIAEKAFQEELKKLQSIRTILLNESGVVRWSEVKNINKYQEADKVLRELLEVYTEIAEEQLPCLKKDYSTKFIGMYSPVRRCLQTSFALTMSRMLSEKHPTLYLNFEHYVGITELLPEIQSRDMADLLYFLTAEKNKFKLRFQTMIRRRGNLDYIPPMRLGQNLLSITVAEWLGLLQRIGELGEYEYVVLDLSESMQGLPDILRMCTKIFTLTQKDHIAQSKIAQYEQILALYEYGDILEKTRWCDLPKIHRLPEDLEQYTRGELADYVKNEINALYGREAGKT